MSTDLRRIVTGHNADGKSIIEIDGGPATEVAADGSGLYEIWMSETIPADNSVFRDKIAETAPTLCPPAGAVKVRWFTVPPEDDTKSAEEKEAAAAFGFEAVGAAHCRVDTTRHLGMHKTASVDYIVLVKGQVDLLLDAGEAKSLKPGDVVIQRGTNHAWVNTGAEPALLVAVLADALIETYRYLPK